MNTAAYLDRLNYFNDPRVQAADLPVTFTRINERTMTGEVEVLDDEADTVTRTLGFRYCVCDTCAGRGKHVNPSVDAGGADTEDWDEEDFERYMGGAYDVACYECKGRGLTPVPEPRDDEERATLAQLEQLYEARLVSAAERRAEAIMGA